MADNKIMDNMALVTFRDGTLDLDVAVSSTENTVWLSFDQISKLFEKDKSTVSRHIRNIFSEGELEEEAAVAKNATPVAQKEEKKIDADEYRDDFYF